MSARRFPRNKLPFRQFKDTNFTNPNFNNKMKKKDFMNQWLKLALKLIKAKALESKIIRNGHLNTHVFTHQDPVNELSLGHFIRIIINFALLCQHTEKRNEFMDYWTFLGNEILDFAESPDIDEFNNQFAYNLKHTKEK